MSKFRKKPETVDACQFDGNIRSLDDFPISEVGKFKLQSENGRYTIIIPAIDGYRKVLPGDWIIKNSNGEYYSCDNYTFTMVYEKFPK